MNTRILILAVLMAATLAADGGGKKATRGKADTTSKTSTPPGPPKTAVETAPGVFRHVDAQGKVWIYRRTPFGWMKAEQKDDQKAAAVSTTPAPETRVVEDGDNVRFERNTPFGVQRWTRKKTEMTEEEKQIFAGASRPARTAETAKPATQE
jgi:hypothetical protein